MDNYAGQQRLMLSMGFTDRAANAEALEACNGQYLLAIEYLTNPAARPTILQSQQSQQYKSKRPQNSKNSSQSLPVYIFPSLPVDQQQKVNQITKLGFDDIGKVRNALSLSKWNIEAAVGLLVEDSQSLRSDFSASETIVTNPDSNGNANEFIFPKLNASQEQAVLQVAAVGFNDEGKIRHALALTNWNIEKAITKMLDDPQLQSDYSALNTSSRYHLVGGQTIADQHAREAEILTSSRGSSRMVISEQDRVSEPATVFHSLNAVYTNTAPNVDSNSSRYDIFRSDEVTKKSSIFDGTSKYNEDPFIEDPFSEKPGKHKYKEIEEFDPFADPNLN